VQGTTIPQDPRRIDDPYLAANLDRLNVAHCDISGNSSSRSSSNLISTQNLRLDHAQITIDKNKTHIAKDGCLTSIKSATTHQLDHQTNLPYQASNFYAQTQSKQYASLSETNYSTEAKPTANDQAASTFEDLKNKYLADMADMPVIPKFNEN
jgi:hypothetical protein